MTYKEKYYEIINTGYKTKPENVYTEKHHIIPRSVCILLDKSQENLIYLTAKNHFLAHYYIWKWFKEELHEKKWARKMCFALNMMKRQLMKSNDIERLSDLYEEVRIEMGKIVSETMKGNIPWNKGKKGIYTEETIQKISDNNKGKIPWNKGVKGLFSGEKNWNFGKHLSEQHKQKLRRPKTEIEKQHMREAKPKKPVVQYTKDMVFVAEYESTREAERRTGVDHRRIINCCRGKIKTTGGFVWKYKN